jgi:hypothetical protein
MVSKNTKITTLFVILGVILWLVPTQVTDNLVIQLAVLFGVGVVLPLIFTERNRRATS